MYIMSVMLLSLLLIFKLIQYGSTGQESFIGYLFVTKETPQKTKKLALHDNFFQPPDYHPSLSELTSGIHPLIFQWTP